MSPGQVLQGMWDPLEKLETRRWWESSQHQSTFTNALRELLGLDPLPTSDGSRKCSACLRTGRPCRKHR